MERHADYIGLVTRSIVHSFDFTGRSRRMEWLCYAIAAAVIGNMITLVARHGLGLAGPDMGLLTPDRVVGLLLALPMFAQFVRRLHDQDRSGWWGLLLLALILCSKYPFLGAIIPGLPASGPAVTATALVLLMAFICFILYPGTDGPNRFGRDPRLSE